MTERAVRLTVRSRWHRFIEWFLPWYDPETEDRRNQRTEAIRQRSIAARTNLERIREAYTASARRFEK